jgi:hypothetical protein
MKRIRFFFNDDARNPGVGQSNSGDETGKTSANDDDIFQMLSRVLNPNTHKHGK